MKNQFEDSQKLIDLLPSLKQNKKNIRANLAIAFTEDEAIKKASRENSLAYLQKCEAEYDRTPFWVWCLTWFTIGILFASSFEAFMLQNHQLIVQWIRGLF